MVTLGIVSFWGALRRALGSWGNKACLACGRGVLLAVAVSVTMPASAAASDIGRLVEHLRIADTVEIMREEGRAYGRDIAREMFPDADPDAWEAVVARIYDGEKMRDLIVDRLDEALAATDLEPLLVFFGSETGRKVVARELAARRALLAPGAEAAALDTYDEMRASGAPLLVQIDRIIDDSDLVELNVMGALNANLMFYRGLADGGAYDLAEADMIADVWSQAPSLRRDTEQWLHAFLLTAYRPLAPARLESYVTLYRTPEGRALNRAMFLALDEMYDEISYLTGRAVARYLRSRKL